MRLNKSYKVLNNVMYHYTFTPQEIEIYRNFLLTKNGYNCNCCNKPINELEELAKAWAIIKNKQRKHPVLVIDHKNGNEKIRDGPDGEYCGNLQLVCYSCNKSKLAEQEPLPLTPISREKQDSTKGEANFHRNLKIYLLDNEHICGAEVGTSSKHLSNNIIKETAGLRYFNSEIIRPSNPKGLYQEFQHDCGAEYCKGVHYSLKGSKPENLLEIEKQKLNQQYNNEYSNGDELIHSRHIKSFGKPFILFQEYYNKYAILGQHQFV